MWSESRSQCGERNQRGRLHPERTQHADTPEFQRAVQVMPRRQDYDHGGDGGRGGSTSREYNYYNHSEEYRGYSADNRDYGYGRRFGPSPKTGSWDDENSRWPREDHSGNRPSDYRDNFRRKNFYSSPHVRERSPHRRETPYYRRESPHSRSGSSISSRSYSPEKNKQPPSHQSQFSKNRERSSVSSLTPSRDASPSGSVLPATSKSFEKSSKTSDNLNKEGVNDWCSEQQQIPELEMPECDTVDAIQMLFPDKLDDLEMNTRSAVDLIDLSQTDLRTKAIAEKTKEIEEVYRQDCETFGMVVQMLIDKDPPLENTIQFSLRENLREIGECCIEELRKFITHYDSAPVEHTQNL
ncbi:periphilin-1 isoform X2 [Carcharodon carcharias]|uniref:periphilin-1 isoform X2 n=1 Tax=Carcharodon carcharias TaxID=13397 RepID=UPI001B7E6AB1|nr:periphilin-1 isoform X2 [Carcharodon carcharias]